MQDKTENYTCVKKHSEKIMYKYPLHIYYANFSRYGKIQFNWQMYNSYKKAFQVIPIHRRYDIRVLLGNSHYDLQN